MKKWKKSSGAVSSRSRNRMKSPKYQKLLQSALSVEDFEDEVAQVIEQPTMLKKYKSQGSYTTLWSTQPVNKAMDVSDVISPRSKSKSRPF